MADTSLIARIVTTFSGGGARRAAAELAALDAMQGKSTASAQKASKQLTTLADSLEKSAQAAKATGMKEAAKDYEKLSRDAAALRTAAQMLGDEASPAAKRFSVLTGAVRTSQRAASALGFKQLSAHLKGLDSDAKRLGAVLRTLGPDGERAARALERFGSSSVTKGLTKARGEVFKFDNAFFAMARRMASMAALIGVAVLGAIGPVVAFTDAIWPMIGALAAVPAVGFGLVAGLAPLLLIFKGLPAAMKKTGGSASNMAQQVADAEHRVQQAQQSALDAQERLNKAREDEARSIRDLTIAYAQAGIDQKEAALAVKDAEMALRQARSSGNREDRQKAELDLESARLAQQRATNNLADTEEQYNQAQQKGVEGSDTVQQALRGQSDATYELAQAQQALVQAQSGGGGTDAAAEAYAKLSDAGKRLVDTVKGLKSQWADFGKEIQQHGLVGMDTQVAGLSNLLLGQRGHVLGIADAWNHVFVSVSQALQAPDEASALDTAMGNVVTMSQNMSNAWAPFVHGFMEFVKVGSDFLPRLGTWVSDLATKFDNWATAAANTGKMHDWISNAIDAAKNFGAIIAGVSSAIGSIFKAGSGGPDYLSKLADDAKRFADTMATPEMQGTLAKFFEAAREVGSSLWVVIKGLADAIVNMPGVIKEAAGALNIIGWALKFAADHASLLKYILPPLVAAFLLYKTVSMGYAVVQKAIWLGTTLWTGAQWLLNVAMDANPIGLIILAIIALIAVIILIIKYHKQIGHFFVYIWGYIWGFLKGVGHWFAHDFVDFFKNAWQWITDRASQFWQWIVDKFNALIDWFSALPGKIADFFQSAWDWAKEKFIDFNTWLLGKIEDVINWVKGLPGRISDAARGMWDGIKNGLRDAINWMIDRWNALDFGIHLHLPSWAGGFGLDINDIFPDIPRLAKGGIVTGPTLALVGDNPSHREAIVPLDRGGAGVASGPMDVHVYVHLDKDKLIRVTRTEIRKRGGNVQKALGRAIA